jgi:hypothetical protein
MGVAVNKNLKEDTKSLPKILGFDDESIKDFEKKYRDFMEGELENLRTSEEGVNSADMYDRAMSTFTGKDLDLFISQITSQAIIMVVENTELRQNTLASLFGGICGPDCDCD